MVNNPLLVNCLYGFIYFASAQRAIAPLIKSNNTTVRTKDSPWRILMKVKLLLQKGEHKVHLVCLMNTILAKLGCMLVSKLKRISH